MRPTAADVDVRRTFPCYAQVSQFYSFTAAACCVVRDCHNLVEVALMVAPMPVGPQEEEKIAREREKNSETLPLQILDCRK